MKKDFLAQDITIQLDIDTPPLWPWQVAGHGLLQRAEKALWGKDTRALGILRARGFSDETIKLRRYGYIPKKEFVQAKEWGLLGDGKMCIERGILIPWISQGELWKLSIRLFDEDIQKNIQEGFGDNRYRCVKGGSEGMYRADTVRKHQPLFIFEGEINADLLAQELEKAGMSEIAVIATGSTSKGRADNWLLLIASASPIILSFDPDKGGDQAQEYWMKYLSHAMPYRTTGGDLNDMLLKGKMWRNGRGAAYNWLTFHRLSLQAPRLYLLNLSQHPSQCARQSRPYDVENVVTPALIGFI